MVSVLMVSVSASGQTVFTAGDIMPGSPDVMLYHNEGLLFTNPESWIVSTLAFPYPDDWAGAFNIKLTIYFIPDDVTVADVDFYALIDSYDVGDQYNLGGFGSLVDPPPVPVGGLANHVFAQEFFFSPPPQKELAAFFLSRRMLGGSPSDTYPTGVYVHAIKVETVPPASAVGTGGPAYTPRLSVHPNPASGTSTINLDLTQGGDVSVEVYDVRGRLVDRIPLGSRTAGTHAVEWTQPVASGTYFLRLMVDGEFLASSKLMRLK
jgi:hypothetical protein